MGAEAFTPASKTNSYALFVLEEQKFGDITAQLGGRVEKTKHQAGALVTEHDHAKHESNMKTIINMTLQLAKMKPVLMPPAFSGRSVEFIPWLSVGSESESL